MIQYNFIVNEWIDDNSNLFIVLPEKTSKGIWFFLPMGIALLVNGSIFSSIMYTLYKIYGNMQQFQLKKKDGDTADKYVYQNNVT